ncbi:MAG TPA: Uma2 family endonuclease, partial [Tepidisphaeraceae bacterium]|nr:Uma2 family endonuclease [Tepidisphaeraceae bacterium]
MSQTLHIPTTHRWTCGEYHAMGDAGLFQDRRVQLIDGEIIDMPPQKNFHAAVVSLAFKAANRVVSGDFWIRCQLPLHLGDGSEPEPDVSVVNGSELDYLGDEHPAHALWVIEVAESTLVMDRKVKASLYASAGIEDYWIINLLDRQVEIHRQPVADGSARFGFSYSD